MEKNNQTIKKKWLQSGKLPCYLVKHQPHVALLGLRYYCFLDQAWIASIDSRSEKHLKKPSSQNQWITTFFFRSDSARYCAPLIPIWFPARLSETSVCFPQKRIDDEIDRNRRITVLLLKASASIGVPSSWIPLFSKSSLWIT